MFEILQYDFMQRALLGGLVIGMITSLIGVFLVLKRMSLLGDSLAHASFGGISLGFLFNINPIYSASVFVIFISLILDKLVSKLKLYGESAIALILAFGISFALIIIQVSGNLNSNIFSYLFGSILTVTYTDILISFLILISILVFYFFNFNTLLYSTFNKEISKVRNKNSELVDKIFIVLSALVIVISIRAVGILLISALLIIPALIGLRLSKSFKSSIYISIFFSILGIYLGIFISYFYDLPTGATIIMSLLFLFFLSVLFEKIKE